MFSNNWIFFCTFSFLATQWGPPTMGWAQERYPVVHMQQTVRIRESPGEQYRSVQISCVRNKLLSHQLRQYCSLLIARDHVDAASAGNQGYLLRQLASSNRPSDLALFRTINLCNRLVLQSRLEPVLSTRSEEQSGWARNLVAELRRSSQALNGSHPFDRTSIRGAVRVCQARFADPLLVHDPELQRASSSATRAQVLENRLACMGYLFPPSPGLPSGNTPFPADWALGVQLSQVQSDASNQACREVCTQPAGATSMPKGVCERIVIHGSPPQVENIRKDEPGSPDSHSAGTL